MDFKDLLLYCVAAIGSIIAAFGSYWARNVDKRLETLEKELAAEKLQSGARLARLEAILEAMKEQLDRIEGDLHADNRYYQSRS